MKIGFFSKLLLHHFSWPILYEILTQQQCVFSNDVSKNRDTKWQRRHTGLRGCLCMCVCVTLRRVWKAVVCITRGRCATMVFKHCSCSSLARLRTCFAHLTSGRLPISCSLSHRTDTTLCTVWNRPPCTPLVLHTYIPIQNITPLFTHSTKTKLYILQQRSKPWVNDGKMELS